MIRDYEDQEMEKLKKGGMKRKRIFMRGYGDRERGREKLRE